MKNIKAVIFDIDGTLTEEISWYTLTEKLGASRDSHSEIFHLYLSQKISYEESKERLIGLWRETGNATRDRISSIFEHIPLRPQAPDTITYLKKYMLCLITGSMDVYAAIVARRLDIPNYYSNTVLEFNEHGDLCDYHYRPNQSAVKMEQLIEFCAARDIHPSECVVVGDSDNDIDIFKLTGNGIALRSATEDKELEGVARHIINSLDELRSLL